MPASKKDLKKAQQKANIKEGVGDAKGETDNEDEDANHGVGGGRMIDEDITGVELELQNLAKSIVESPKERQD